MLTQPVAPRNTPAPGENYSPKEVLRQGILLHPAWQSVTRPIRADAEGFAKFETQLCGCSIAGLAQATGTNHRVVRPHLRKLPGILSKGPLLFAEACISLFGECRDAISNSTSITSALSIFFVRINSLESSRLFSNHSRLKASLECGLAGSVSCVIYYLQFPFSRQRVSRLTQPRRRILVLIAAQVAAPSSRKNTRARFTRARAITVLRITARASIVPIPITPGTILIAGAMALVGATDGMAAAAAGAEAGTAMAVIAAGADPSYALAFSMPVAGGMENARPD